MFKVLKYSFFDLIRSRWIYVYFLFFILVCLGLLYLSSDLSKAVVSLMNIVIVVCPLVGVLFGALYYYHSREFIELLLALPLRRQSIFLGNYLGVSLALSSSFLLGTGIAFTIYGTFVSNEIWNFTFLLIAGTMLTFIFTSLACLLTIMNENPIRGFGLALFVWLFLAVIYDGLFMLLLIFFHQYPLDNYALITTLLNPIDLSRVMVMLKLDISALMGYTGAVFKKFFGTWNGIAISMIALTIWIILPVWLYLRVSKRKNF